jgi:hypothetical protein
MSYPYINIDDSDYVLYLLIGKVSFHKNFGL